MAEKKVTDEMLAAASDADDVANNNDSVTDESDNGAEEPEAKKEDGNSDDEEDTEKLKEKLKRYQDERSGFGRRLSTMEKEIQERNDRLDAVLDRMESLAGNSRDNAINDDIDNDMPLTKAELKKLLREERELETKESLHYSQNYLRQFSKMGRTEDPEYYDAIFKEMEKNFNNKITGNPIVDAELNYDKAEKALLKKTLASSVKKNPLKGEKIKEALGVGGDSNMGKSKDFVMPKLDKAAAAFMEYAKHKNMSQERIERALTKDK